MLSVVVLCSSCPPCLISYQAVPFQSIWLRPSIAGSAAIATAAAAALLLLSFAHLRALLVFSVFSYLPFIPMILGHFVVCLLQYVSPLYAWLFRSFVMAKIYYHHKFRCLSIQRYGNSIICIREYFFEKKTSHHRSILMLMRISFGGPVSWPKINLHTFGLTNRVGYWTLPALTLSMTKRTIAYHGIATKDEQEKRSQHQFARNARQT